MTTTRRKFLIGLSALAGIAVVPLKILTDNVSGGLRIHLSGLQELTTTVPYNCRILNIDQPDVKLTVDGRTAVIGSILREGQELTISAREKTSDIEIAVARL